MNHRAVQSLLLCAVLGVSAAWGQMPTNPPAVPAGTVYHFVGMIYLSGRIEFRDVSETLWPNYWYEGKFGDVRGQFVFDPQNPSLNVSLTCPKLAQGAAGHDLKILGETMADGQIPPTRFTVHRMGPWLTASPADKIGACEQAPIEGELAVGDRRMAVKTNAIVRYTLPRDRNEMSSMVAGNLMGMSVSVKVDFTIKGRDLGLKKVADKEIRVTVHSRAFTEPTILDGTKKKTLAEAGVRR
jgi:hypothetical protein